MRKIGLAVVVALCVMSMAVPGYCGCGCSSCSSQKTKAYQREGGCQPDHYEGGNALKKLGRGACNLATFPFEVFLQMSRVGASDGPMASWSWGLLKGLGMAGTRAVVGVYEIVTFPLPCPEGYRPILTDPEFFFEDQNW